MKIYKATSPLHIPQSGLRSCWCMFRHNLRSFWNGAHAIFIEVGCEFVFFHDLTLPVRLARDNSHEVSYLSWRFELYKRDDAPLSHCGLLHKICQLYCRAHTARLPRDLLYTEWFKGSRCNASDDSTTSKSQYVYYRNLLDHMGTQSSFSVRADRHPFPGCFQSMSDIWSLDAQERFQVSSSHYAHSNLFTVLYLFICTNGQIGIQGVKSS